jgi:hypothetical protein
MSNFDRTSLSSALGDGEARNEAYEDRVFDCRLYVSRRGAITLRMPTETGPVRVARLEALDYDALVDPTFRRLLAAFESVPQPLFVQV